MKTVSLISFFVALILFHSSSLANEPLVIEAYYETSLAKGYESIECAFSGTCKKGWRPDASDSGRLEGFYFRLKEPVSMVTPKSKNFYAQYVIIVELASLPGNCEASFYADGQHIAFDWQETIQAKSGSTNCVFSNPNWDEADGFFVQKFKSFFFRWSGESEPPTVKRVMIAKRVDAAKSSNSQGLISGKHVYDKKLKTFFQPIEMKTPKRPRLKQVVASSQLKPVSAYQPSNLFDFVPMSAFSFDGSKNNGVGETLTFKFGKPVNISAIKVANGYQRSQSHFDANGRVKKVTLKFDGKKPQSLTLDDNMGLIRTNLKSKVKGVSELELKIDEVYEGKDYKDLLMSELQFVDDKGAVFIPQYTQIRPSLPKGWSKYIDRTMLSVPDQASPIETPWQSRDKKFELTIPTNKTQFGSAIRLRSNGNFVIYTKQIESQVSSEEGGQVKNRKAQLVNRVFEGNWDQPKGKLRIFGRRYFVTQSKTEQVEQGGGQGYGVISSDDKESKKEGIFQSFVTLQKYSQFSKAKKSAIKKLLVKQHSDKKLIGKALADDPLVFHSSVLTAIVE
ncbi:MAG: hypothetical protein HRT45_07435 [Bdellovibrionales bacterium]|nr:hypothetical protein [Bdellovibrionales bacterium]